MRKISLSKTGFSKLRSFQKELRAADFDDSIKSFTPGEWCWIEGQGQQWVGFVNPLVDDKYTSVYALESVPSKTGSFSAEDFISGKIRDAYTRRRNFQDYENGCRAFYGGSDGLPGLIVDKYTNAAIIQINTAGVDRYREHILSIVSEVLGVPGYLLDNQKYREKEGLPVFAGRELPDLVIKENGLTYKLKREIIQKVGFYYDHRENRRELQLLLARLSLKPKQGLDLFSYAGAWGMNALKAGAGFVEFVDQADMGAAVESSLSENGFNGKGSFHRADVFKYLDDSSAAGKKYDLILCDPPAFAKNQQQKSQALEGYSKLHRKVLKLAAPGSVCVFSSCTHYVGLEEFQKNIVDAAHKENRKVQLLHCGVQGWDHPVSSFDERANYIKSFTYLLES